MKLILIFAQAITQQEQIIGFFYEAIYMFFFGVITSIRLYNPCRWTHCRTFRIDSSLVN